MITIIDKLSLNFEGYKQVTLLFEVQPKSKKSFKIELHLTASKFTVISEIGFKASVVLLKETVFHGILVYLDLKGQKTVFSLKLHNSKIVIIPGIGFKASVVLPKETAFHGTLVYLDLKGQKTVLRPLWCQKLLFHTIPQKTFLVKKNLLRWLNLK